MTVFTECQMVAARNKSAEATRRFLDANEADYAMALAAAKAATARYDFIRNAVMDARFAA